MSQSSFSPSRPVALVTGASRGIGRAVSLRLASQGYNVVLNFLRSKDAAVEVARQCSGEGAEVMIVRADVSSPDDVTGMVDGAIERFGRLDAVISNAAAGGFRGLTETTPINLEAALRCNALPAVSLATATVEHLSRTPDRDRQGKFVAISSHGSRWAVPNYGAIGASKAALESYVRHLSLEHGDRGINFNCVLPGIIATEAVASMPAVAGVIDAAQKRMMMGDRKLTESDVAGVVSFLCSRDSDLIQGHTLVVDGGVSIRV